MDKEKIKKFEDFLEDKHAKVYQGFDDNMSYDFDNWLVDLEIDEIIKYADEYTKQVLQAQKQKLLGKIEERIPNVKSINPSYLRDVIKNLKEK